MSDTEKLSDSPLAVKRFGPVSQPRRWSLHSLDGRTVKEFGGRAEVWLVAARQPADPLDMRLVLPLVFPTRDDAERAAGLLGSALEHQDESRRGLMRFAR